MVLNKSSKDVWQYQDAVGTAQITAATGVDAVCFEFGEYNEECGKWSIPTTQNPAEPHWVYNSGTPTLTNAARKFDTFKKVFLPVTAQVYAWFQGLPVNDNPGTPDTVSISTLTSGMTYPLTIRVQEDEGTHPDHVQAVDCYCIALTSNAERGKEFLVEAEFVYGEIQDQHTYDNITDPPLAAGLMTGAYNGNPILEWNGVPILGVEKAVWMEAKKHSVVTSDEGVVQTIHTDKSESVKIILWGGIEVDDLWDDYKAMAPRVIRDMTIQVVKYDSVSNIMFTFTNCRITSYERIGAQYEGKYASIIKIEAEKVTPVSDWFTEGGVVFATHWKAAL